MKLKVYHGIENHFKISYFLLKKIFFKILSQNSDYILSHCNDCRKPFNFACRLWYSYSYMYSNTNTSIIILIFV